MNNNSQDWYFQKDSDVLFVDEDTQRVGILQPNPLYTLDINGNISASNILGVNAVIPYIQNEVLLGDVVNSQSNISDYIEATTAEIDHIDCVSLNAMSNVVVGSNLAILNTYLNQECPFPGEANFFGFNDQGWIHSSWIHTDPDMMELLGKLWDIGAAGWDIFDAVKDLYTYVNPNATGITDQMLEDLSDALNDGETDSNKKVYVSWDNLNNKPVYADKISNRIGLKGDLYIDESKSIYSLNSSYITSGQRNNLTIISTLNADKILDVGSKHAYLNDITTSNIIVTSNLQSPSIVADDIITNKLSGNSVRVGDFYVRSDGIFFGNPDIPLESKQIINNVGDFVGTVNKSQIIDLEAFSLSAASDGTLVWTGYGDVVGNELLNDPFAFQIPLYNVS